MNERIKLLAEQAKDYADYYSMLSDSAEQEIFTEKFAELIVKECRQVLVDMIDEGRGDFLTLDIALIDIDDKFGIEE